MRKYDILLIDIDDTILSLSGGEEIAFKKLMEYLAITDKQSFTEAFFKVTEQYWQDYDNNVITPQDCDDGLRFTRLFAEMKMPYDGKEAYDYFTRETCANIMLVEDAKEIVEQLAENYTLYCISNGLHDLQIERLKSAGLYQYFQDCFISDRIGFVKPSFGFFDYVYNKIGRPDKDKILIIGDTVTTDILGGSNYGIDTCWFNHRKESRPKGMSITYEISELRELREIL